VRVSGRSDFSLRDNSLVAPVLRETGFEPLPSYHKGKLSWYLWIQPEYGCMVSYTTDRAGYGKERAISDYTLAVCVRAGTAVTWSAFIGHQFYYWARFGSNVLIRASEHPRNAASKMRLELCQIRSLCDLEPVWPRDVWCELPVQAPAWVSWSLNDFRSIIVDPSTALTRMFLGEEAGHHRGGVAAPDTLAHRIETPPRLHGGLSIVGTA